MADNPKHGLEHQAKVTELTASLPDSADPSASYTQELDPGRSGTEVQYLFRAQDSTLALLDPQHFRRKQSIRGAERKKHRRTRSGCYTCRARRIKCDETHPICERCRKGSRDCVYPELAINSKEASNCEQGPIRESPSSSSDEYEDNVQRDIQLQTVLDEDKGLGSTVWPARASTVSTFRYNEGQVCNPSQTSEVPPLDKGASPTPSTEGSMDYSTSVYRHRFRPRADPRSRPSELEWSHLPTELQSLLTYFYENVNYLHYSLKLDSSNFLKTDFIKAALEYEPLLYAVAGFSSFQRTLRNPKGNIQDFLPYYNKAVSSLLKSLQRRDDRSTGMILAILQLATIEEFLGDWINLLGHQRAAYQILTEIYTPETVLVDNTSRVILGWYMRFDVFAGLMGGFDTVLSRDWFSGIRDFFQQQVRTSPAKLEWKMELAISQLRLVAMDMSNLFVRMGKGEITQVSFAEENEDIRRRIESWRTELDEGLQDTQQPTKDASDYVSLQPLGIVGPYLSGRIYSGLLWPMNISTIDWYAIFLMHRYQTALATQTQPGPELGVKALESCQMFEAIELNSESPPGTVLAMQASHGIASLFLPRDEKHSMWARRKLATIESQGYIYPLTFRRKMADLFKDQSCLHWWLPNDEAYPPVIRSIRKFVEERTSPAIDVTGEDLRDMKAVFASLQLRDVKDTSRTGH